MKPPSSVVSGLVALVLAPVLLAVVSTPAAAQNQDQLAAQLAAKKSAAFVRKADWALDMASARSCAKERGQLIFTYFTRSYAP